MGRAATIVVSLLVVVVLAAVAAGGYYYFSIRPQQAAPLATPAPAPAVTRDEDRVGFGTLPTPQPPLAIQTRLSGVQHDFRSNPELVVWGKLEKLDEVSVRISNPEGPVYEYFFAAGDPEVVYGRFSRASGEKLAWARSEIAVGDDVSLYLRADVAADTVADITLNEVIP